MTERTASDTPGISVLGAVSIDGAPVTGLLPRRLIAALALAAPHTLSSDALVDAIWGDEPPANARSALQTLVSRTRGVTGAAAIELTPSGYRLAVNSDIGTARSAADDEIENALSLWHGDAGDDLGDAPVAEELRAAASALRQHLTRRHAAQLMLDRQWAEAVRLLAPLVDAAPLDEAEAVLLMRALDGAGRRNDALAVFARLRDSLAEALGTGPGREAVELNASLLRAEAAPRTRIGVRAATTPLIGRRDDITAVESLLADSRLVTLLGVGGLGKTSLAHEIARRSDTPTVAVVELAGTSSADDIVLTIATTLGIRTVTSAGRLTDPLIRTDLRTRIAQSLSDADSLLVLDNCEHLVDAAAGVAAEMLGAVAGLRILATSRSPLAIAGEQVVQLPPLDVADAASSGVVLFLERARAVRPQAELDPVIVTRICERLDGLPLAIELAAARVRSLSLDDIERRLRDRFALLTTVDRAAPERHRTLFAVIDWSWKLLEPRQQTVLRRLSLFADGFTSDAAAAVAASGSDVVDELDALVMQSLVTVRDVDGSARFRMLETVREFGRDRLDEAGERERIESVQLDWARDFARDQLPLIFGSTQVVAMRQVAREHENLGAALRRATQTETVDVALAVFGILAVFWSMRGEHEEVLAHGASFCRLARRHAIPASVADAAGLGLVIAAMTFTFNGETRIGIPAFARARSLWRSGMTRNSRIGAMLELAEVISTGKDADALSTFSARVEHLATSGDPAAASIATIFGANVAENNGELDTALRLAHETHRLSHVLDDAWIAAGSAMTLAQLYSESARPIESLRWCREARSGLRAIGAENDMKQIDWMLALALTQHGDDAAARELLPSDSEATGTEARAIVATIRAESELRAGRTDAALALYDAATTHYTAPAERASPWYMMSLSVRISAHLLAGDQPADVAGDARRLRARALAVARTRIGVDQPVTGAAAMGLSLWAMSHAATEELGLELLALSEQLSARQDFAPLRLATHFAAAERLHGAASVADARERAGARDVLDRVERTYALLGDRLWRGL